LQSGEDTQIAIELAKLPEQTLPTPSPKPFTNTIGMTFAYIAPGEFDMGTLESNSVREKDEKQHRVTLSQGFFIQRKEVTVAQWRAFVQSSGYRSEAENDGGGYIWTGSAWEQKPDILWSSPGYPQQEDHPVTCISYNDVQAFIDWLSAKEGRTYHLPTEAQWEYAARAGSTSAFANGKIDKLNCERDPNLDAMGWYCGNSEGKTHPVAQKQKNAWGLHDMHGNVWEWCQDWYGSYRSDAAIDPVGPTRGVNRVLRGGSFTSNAKSCRAANRSSNKPEFRSYNYGFRLAVRLTAQ
jgi:formylglycine-generating enzyme required for sulfatase activity